MELSEVLRRRRMVRAFRVEPLPVAVVDRVLEAAGRAPSAGFSQGLDLVVLDDRASVDRYWDLTFPDPGARRAFRWQGLFAAPVLVIPVVDPGAYAARYGEPDKEATGLGGVGSWPVPYWWVDGGAAVQNLLLSAVDEGLGALFFGLFSHERAVLDDLGVPAGRRALGAVALGHPAPDEPGRSATRPRRPRADVVHRNHW
ncbi:MAG: nitroreductase family protein, partial [Actinomycetota bacterium]|nr:nitroreductase family protein [Actinomycetota bacterium]